MNTLCIDTCDQYGSVAVRLDGHCVGLRPHPGTADYSSWLLPAVESLLWETDKPLAGIDLLAVATGPGSFTAVRVGLCTVKAWAEVYGKPVVGVSRLEAMARSAAADGWIAATYDAHRGQIFAALYRRTSGNLSLIEEQLVISPADFLAFVKQRTAGDSVQYFSLEPELLSGLQGWSEFELRGSQSFKLEPGLANSIGELAEAKAAMGEFTDVLSLDANYVRRSDAEIYWKGPSHRAG